MTFGERLRYLREERGLRQQDVAEKINISKRMIGYYESDKHFPRDAEMVIAIADFFDVSLDYLFGISEVKNIAVFDELTKEFSKLDEKNQSDVFDYIRYLKLKIPHNN